MCDCKGVFPLETICREVLIQLGEFLIRRPFRQSVLDKRTSGLGIFAHVPSNQ